MKKEIIFILTSLLLLTQCKKEDLKSTEATIDSPDTISPGSFYPIYPGSFWEYRINDSIIKKHETSPIFVLDSFLTNNWSPKFYSKPAYVPLLDGEPIYRYQKVVTSNWHGANHPEILQSFLSENVGDTINDISGESAYYLGETLIIDKKEILNGREVITVRGFIRYYEPSYRSTRQYEKNVGLINYYKFGAPGDTIYKQELINYFVNH